MTVKAYDIAGGGASAGSKPSPLPYEGPHYSLEDLEYQAAVLANLFSKYKYRRGVVETPGSWQRIVFVPQCKIRGELEGNDILRRDGCKFVYTTVEDPGCLRPTGLNMPQQDYRGIDLATREIVWHMTQELPPEADWPERWTAMGITRSRQAYIVRNFGPQLGLM